MIALFTRYTHALFMRYTPYVDFFFFLFFFSVKMLVTCVRFVFIVSVSMCFHDFYLHTSLCLFIFSMKKINEIR